METDVRETRKTTWVLSIACCLAMASVHADPSQDMAALRNFRLTDAFLAKYEAVMDAAAKDPCHLDPSLVLRGNNKSLEQMAADYDARPGVHAMLARHGITAREVVLGEVTLMLAGFEAMKEAHPGMAPAGGSTPPVSPENLAFYRTHRAAIHQHAMQLGQEMLRANQGGQPGCAPG